MNTRNRNLLTVALASALVAPFAAANGLVDADPAASAQVETTQSELDEEASTEALPPQVNPVEEREQDVDPRAPIDDAAEDPMSAVPPPPPPVQSQDATQAVDHSDVAQRARWAGIDADGDGRISAAEAAVDADFSANFEMMDGDGDGFVTDAEFRAHAKANPPRDDHGGMDGDGIDHDGMDHDRMDDDRSDHTMDRDDHEDGMDDDAADARVDDDMDDPVDDWN